MFYTKPSKGLASILPSQIVRSKKSFRSIVQDVTKNMSIGEARAAKRIFRQMNTDPAGIVLNRRTKRLFQAMGKAGEMKVKYQYNPAMALGHMQRVADVADATNVSPTQHKEQERAEARKEAGLQNIARERREEAEGHLTEEEIHNHGDIHSTSMRMKEWRGAKVSVGQISDEKSARQVSAAEAKPPAADDESPLVDMAIG